MHTDVHSNIVYNCQDMEATWVSINRQMDEEIVIYKNGMLLSHKNKIKFCHLQQCGWTQKLLRLVK